MNTKRLLLALLSIGTLHAADVSISGLPAITTVQAGTLVPVVDVAGTPTTKKATVSQIITGLPDATTTTDGIMAAADKLALTSATSAASASTLMTRDSSANSAVNQLTASIVTGLALPINPTDAASKIYVDSAAAGLNIKTPAAAATTANVTLSGGAPTVVDGVTLALNTRVLVKAQTDDTQNGIYYVTTLGSGSNGTWTRTTDANTGALLTTGSYVYVTGGTAAINTAWVMSTPGTITIGSSHIIWALFSQLGQIQASSIIGQIVNAQIADAAISFTKFANTIQPVSLVSTLPSPSGYTGPSTLFNTSDGKLYRYIGGSFTAAVPTTDLSGSITTTQITDNSISTAKLQANSVTATNIAVNAVTAGDIAANAVTSGTIAAGAVSTTELAAGAVTAGKIAAGTIVSTNIAALTITGANIAAGTISADKINVASLSAISANIGTITAGSISASASISLSSSNNAVNIDSTGMTVAGGRIDFTAIYGNPCITVKGSGPTYPSNYIRISGGSSLVPPMMQFFDPANLVSITSYSVMVSGSGGFVMGAGTTLSGPGSILFNGGAASVNLIAGETPYVGTLGGYMNVTLNGRVVEIPFYNTP